MSSLKTLMTFLLFLVLFICTSCELEKKEEDTNEEEELKLQQEQLQRENTPFLSGEGTVITNTKSSFNIEGYCHGQTTQVQLFINGDYSTDISCEDNRFETEFETSIDGTFIFYVTSKNVANTASDHVTWIRDTTSPSTPIFDSDLSTSAIESYTESNGKYALLLNGTCDASEALVHSVQLYRNSALYATTKCENGYFFFYIPPGNTSYSFTLSAKDQAGNVSSTSASTTVAFDDKGPVAEDVTISPTTSEYINNSYDLKLIVEFDENIFFNGYSNSDIIDNLVDAAGTGTGDEYGENVLLTIFLNDNATCVYDPSDDYSLYSTLSISPSSYLIFSCNIAQSNGSLKYEALPIAGTAITDEHGNLSSMMLPAPGTTGSVSGKYQITMDNYIGPLKIDLEPEFKSSDESITISGECDSSDGTEIVQLFIGTGTYTTDCENSYFEFEYSSSSQGSHIMNIVVSDDAGNSSSGSGIWVKDNNYQKIIKTVFSHNGYVEVIKATTDQNGDFYLIGKFSNDIHLGDFILYSLTKAYDIFIAKISANGEPVWLNSYGGAWDDEIYDIAIKNSKIAIIGNIANSSNSENLYGSGFYETFTTGDGKSSKFYFKTSFRPIYDEDNGIYVIIQPNTVLPDDIIDSDFDGLLEGNTNGSHYGSINYDTGEIVLELDSPIGSGEEVTVYYLHNDEFNLNSKFKSKSSYVFHEFIGSGSGSNEGSSFGSTDLLDNINTSTFYIELSNDNENFKRIGEIGSGGKIIDTGYGYIGSGSFDGDSNLFNIELETGIGSSQQIYISYEHNNSSFHTSNQSSNCPSTTDSSKENTTFIATFDLNGTCLNTKFFPNDENRFSVFDLPQDAKLAWAQDDLLASFSMNQKDTERITLTNPEDSYDIDHNYECSQVILLKLTSNLSEIKNISSFLSTYCDEGFPSILGTTKSVHSMPNQIIYDELNDEIYFSMTSYSGSGTGSGSYLSGLTAIYDGDAYRDEIILSEDDNDELDYRAHTSHVLLKLDNNLTTFWANKTNSERSIYKGLEQSNDYIYLNSPFNDIYDTGEILPKTIYPNGSGGYTSFSLQLPTYVPTSGTRYQHSQILGFDKLTGEPLFSKTLSHETSYGGRTPRIMGIDIDDENNLKIVGVINTMDNIYLIDSINDTETLIGSGSGSTYHPFITSFDENGDHRETTIYSVSGSDKAKFLDIFVNEDNAQIIKGDGSGTFDFGTGSESLNDDHFLLIYPPLID